MIIDINEETLGKSIQGLEKRLLESRTPHGFWQGRLSSSALSTATAVFALTMVDEKKYQTQIQRGLKWLRDNSNSDGGWGDTPLSISNISTTMLCWAAFKQTEIAPEYEKTVTDTEKWLIKNAGSLEPEQLLKTVNAKYGKDRTFSSPILMMCALAGMLNGAEDIWKLLKPLPFELAIVPHKFYKFLRLPVVSYALPALIAIGQLQFHRRKPANPITRLLRYLTQDKTYNILKKIQPENGGFLEAAPLTSFVVISLAATGKKDSIVTKRGIGFLLDLVREDGSWPIDTNLATWVTTLSINALAGNPDFKNILPTKERKDLQQWLLVQQHRKVHPYTNAAPGGWAWTDAPGAVPDADDTAGVLIALYNLDLVDDNVTEAVRLAIEWLLDIQNKDGGIPTFCKGWNKLPFDRSAADITAHVITAMKLWLDFLPDSMQKLVKAAIQKALGYLQQTQQGNGSWLPLWFGNQFESQQQNPVYGTAKVLISLSQFINTDSNISERMFSDSVKWLLEAQNHDGGWGPSKSIISSIEETSLAVDALVSLINQLAQRSKKACDLFHNLEQMRSAVLTGTAWLIKRTDKSFTAAPIGLYFARLWYFEELYPVIFALSAMKKMKLESYFRNVISLRNSK